MSQPTSRIGQPHRTRSATVRFPFYIHYQARCQSKHGCAQSAVIQIECRDSIGHLFWNRDYCEAHAQSALERAEASGISVSWL